MSRRVFKTASMMAAGLMFVAAVACNIAPAALIRIFSDDPAVDRRRRRIPAHHLVELRRIGAGVRHIEHVPGDGQHDSVAAGVHQPDASSSRFRSLLLSRLPGFELRWIWYLSVVAILMQLAIILLLLRREFRLRLDPMGVAPIPGSAPATS